MDSLMDFLLMHIAPKERLATGYEIIIIRSIYIFTTIWPTSVQINNQ